VAMPSSMRPTTDDSDQRNRTLGSAQTRPSLQRGQSTRHVAEVGGWEAPPSIGSPGGMPHRRWGRKAEVRTLRPHRRRGLATHARPTAEPFVRIRLRIARRSFADHVSNLFESMHRPVTATFESKLVRG
jgi:hypothetical protein